MENPDLPKSLGKVLEQRGSFWGLFSLVQAVWHWEAFYLLWHAGSQPMSAIGAAKKLLLQNGGLWTLPAGVLIAFGLQALLDLMQLVPARVRAWTTAKRRDWEDRANEKTLMDQLGKAQRELQQQSLTAKAEMEQQKQAHSEAFAAQQKETSAELDRVKTASQAEVRRFQEQHRVSEDSLSKARETEKALERLVIELLDDEHKESFCFCDPQPLGRFYRMMGAGKLASAIVADDWVWFAFAKHPDGRVLALRSGEFRMNERDIEEWGVRHGEVIEKPLKKNYQPQHSTAAKRAGKQLAPPPKTYPPVQARIEPRGKGRFLLVQEGPKNRR